MPDRNLPGAHIAGQSGESEAAANIPAKIDDQASTALPFEIVNRGIQRVRKSHPHGAGKVRNLQCEPGVAEVGPGEARIGLISLHLPPVNPDAKKSQPTVLCAEQRV